MNPPTLAPLRQNNIVLSQPLALGQRGSPLVAPGAHWQSHPPLLAPRARWQSRPPLLAPRAGRWYVLPPSAPQTYPLLHGTGRVPMPIRMNRCLSAHPRSPGCPTRYRWLPFLLPPSPRRRQHRCQCPPLVPTPIASTTSSSSCPPWPSLATRPQRNSPSSRLNPSAMAPGDP